MASSVKLYFNDLLLNKRFHIQVSFTKSEWDSLLCERASIHLNLTKKLLDGNYILCYDWGALSFRYTLLQISSVVKNTCFKIKSNCKG